MSTLIKIGVSAYSVIVAALGGIPDIPNGSIIDPVGGASIVDPADDTTYIVDPGV